MTDERRCYVVTHGANPRASVKKWGGFMPSLVIEGDEGHYPMTGGDHEWAVPWIWGKSKKQAQKIANKYNREVLNLSAEDVDIIIFSSFQRDSINKSFHRR